MSLLDDVKARLDIADVVSGYVTLAQAGRNLRARCPFHTERTPSFYVFPERQAWRCFGACAEGGDAISFVMKLENVEFRGALRTLAERVGVPLPKPRAQRQVSPLHRANDAAARFYHERLVSSPEGAQALAYLEERGVTRETAAAFGLGLSPVGWDELRGHLAAQGFQDDLLVEAGLLQRSPAGGVRDLFHGRLMFPIRDADGRTAGFGGRSLDGSDPKYLNTPRTSVFDKSSILYALDAAAESIRLEGVGVVVEGYMDALMAHQYGFRNVVASMGTALTSSQVEQLKGLGRHYVLALDPDVAGQEATLRSLETSWQVFRPPARSGGSARTGRSAGRDVRLRVALLPAGRDPDDLIRHDPDGWRRAVEDAADLVDFLFETLPPRYDLDTPEGKLALAERLGGVILSAEDTAGQDRQLERLEGVLGVTRGVLDEALQLRRRALLRGAGRDRRGAREDVQGYAAPFARSSRDPLEEYTLALLLQNPSLWGAAEAAAHDYFQRSENREVYRAWAGCGTISELRVSIDPDVMEHLEALLNRTLPPMDLRELPQALSHCLRRMEERRLRELTAQEGALLAQVQGQPEEEEVLQGLRGRTERLREIFATRVRRERDVRG